MEGGVGAVLGPDPVSQRLMLQVERPPLLLPRRVPSQAPRMMIKQSSDVTLTSTELCTSWHLLVLTFLLHQTTLIDVPRESYSCFVEQSLDKNEELFLTHIIRFSRHLSGHTPREVV
eukprot:537285-Rhodomonas_salina.1